MQTFKDYSRKDLSDFLRSKGVSATVQRIELAHYILQNFHHISSDEINQILANPELRVSRATIYNTLNLFAEIGLLARVELAPNSFIYDINVGEHHHLIDSRTGALVDVELDPAVEQRLLTEIQNALKDKLPAGLKRLQLVLRGEPNVAAESA